MVSAAKRTEYHGSEDALVIALDIGTTFSGASYTILRDGQVPQIASVTQYDGQEDQAANSKVPTVLLYNLDGELLACGAEAVNWPGRDSRKFVTVEWFKLDFRPTKITPVSGAPKVKLPKNHTVDDVLADFLGYMKKCVGDYIKETTFNGPEVWATLEGNARYILTHPNGWSGRQQDRMREAAIRAGLVPGDHNGRSRIAFLTEGEASLHWCIDQGLATSLEVGSQIIVADVGGGTIDVSSFEVCEASPVRLKESSIPACLVAGSVFVTEAFRTAIQDRLKLSALADEEDLDRIVDEFDKKTKRLFRPDDASVFIKVGNRHDNFPQYGVHQGQLEVDRQTIIRTFQKSCDAVVSAIRERAAPEEHRQGTHVFLVGGFAASPWLFSEVRRLLQNDVREVRRANSNTAKAVSEGAIAYYLDKSFNKYDRHHRERSQDIFVFGNGKKYVKGGFSTLVKKGQTIGREEVYRDRAHACTDTLDDFPVTFDLYRYTGTRDEVKFMSMDKESNFQKVCQYTGIVPRSAFQRKSNVRKSYYRAVYDVVVALGATEMSCYLEWKENEKFGMMDMLNPVNIPLWAQQPETRRSNAISVWDDF